MKKRFYKFLIALTHGFGAGAFLFFAWWLASGYFLFFPFRLAESVRFYRAVFPDRGWPFAVQCAWKQYHSFTQVFLDRILLPDDLIGHTHEGWEHIENAVNRGTGGILLMSHVGNWELASRVLALRGKGNPKMKLLLYMGRKHKEQIEETQKEDLLKSGIRIIATGQEGGSPADLVEGIRFLKAGGLVSLTGDHLWDAGQRTVEVTFFGREAVLPETPFLFALLSGAPLLIFFTFRTGERAFHVKALPPLYIRAEGRKDRDKVIRSAAQFYAKALEETVRQHPFEWFHFERFIR
jgi:predicted LPLAT superfamily acyltransferase